MLVAGKVNILPCKYPFAKVTHWLTFVTHEQPRLLAAGCFRACVDVFGRVLALPKRSLRADMEHYLAHGANLPEIQVVAALP